MRSVSFIMMIAMMAVTSLVIDHRQAQAGPWAEAGDRQLRSDIELLSQYGLIRGPITTWPLPWAQISARLSDAGEQTLPPHVRMAVSRVRSQMPSARDFGRPVVQAEMRATNRARVSRDFGDAARDRADVSVSAEMNWSSVAARVNVGYQGDDVDDSVVLDGSYLAAATGNWTIYGGLVDHWWGPGWSSSLIMSSNARPMPRVGLMRLDPKPFETRWLSWLGPWQINVFLGGLNDSGRVVEDPLVVGFRATIEPIPNLEIGASRTIMLCGKGRSCDFDTWTRALVSFGGLTNTSDVERNPANQLAGFDIRYGFRIGETLSAAVYGQMIGEDEKDSLPFKFAHLAGISIDGPWGGDGAMWRLTGEFTDTAADGIFRDTEYNVLYNHSAYRSGYRYRGRSLGDRLDSDSTGWSISGMFTSTDQWTYRLSYQNVHINRDDDGRNDLSTNAERINIIEAGLRMPTPAGDLSLELRHEDDRPNTPGFSDSTTAVEAGWLVRF